MNAGAAMSDPRELYWEYKRAEVNFVHYVLENCEALFNDYTPDPEHPDSLPIYIRWLGYAKDEATRTEVLQRLEALKEKYFHAYMANKDIHPQAYKENVKKGVERREDMIYPKRFLQYMPEAKNVTISIYDAWQSKGEIKKDKGYSFNVRMKDVEDGALKALKATYPSLKVSALMTCYNFLISGEDLYKAANQKEPLNGRRLFIRKHTGFKYTANIGYADGNGVSLKTSLNFILVDKGCYCAKCTPRKPRADSLEQTADRYELPYWSEAALSRYWVWAKNTK